MTNRGSSVFHVHYAVCFKLFLFSLSSEKLTDFISDEGKSHLAMMHESIWYMYSFDDVERLWYKITKIMLHIYEVE